MKILNDPIIFLYVAIIAGIAFMALFIYLLLDTIQKRKQAQKEMEEKTLRSKKEIVNDVYSAAHHIVDFLNHPEWPEDGSSIHLLAALSRHLHDDFEELCVINDNKAQDE